MNYDEKLNELAALPRDWDSYGGPKIGPEAIHAARLLFRGLAIVPCSNGGLQIESHSDSFDFELEISPEGRVQSILIEGLR